MHIVFERVLNIMGCIYNNLNLIDLNDYPVSRWEKLLKLGHEIKENPQKYSEE